MDTKDDGVWKGNSGLESSTISGIHYSKKGFPPFVFDSQRVGSTSVFFLKKRWTKSKSEKDLTKSVNFGILGRSLQKNEKTTTVHLHIWISLPHWISNSWHLFLRKIWSGGTSSYLPGGSETPKFPEAEKTCWTFLGTVQENLECFNLFWGRARNKSDSVIRITETNESDIWIYHSLET